MTVVDFGAIPELPLDEAYALTAAYKQDDYPQKVILGAGVYKDENGQPWVLPCVKEAKRVLYETTNLDHEYLPLQGNDRFNTLARELALGQTASSRANHVSVQTISGTGANHLGALFLAQQLKPKNVWISAPTWGNHHLIWLTAAPNVTRKEYPYYDPSTNGLDFDGMVAALETAEANDVVLLHACAHNPTGIDLTQEQWRVVAELCRRKRLFVFFDSAYQGFASGDVDADGWAVRYFLDTLFGGADDATAPPPVGMCVAQSFAKSFGLYGERVGAFHLVLPAGVQSAGTRSQLLRLIRAEISTCPLYGARIVETVLADPKMRAMWAEDLKTMSSRMKGVRAALRSEIEKLPGSGDWEHLTTQIGMFSFTGLTEGQVKQLRDKHHIYMMKNGRISLSGINAGNVEYVAQSIHEVLSAE